MPLVPDRFLFRIAYRALYLPGIPQEGDEDLFDLPELCRLDNFAALDNRRSFADFRLAWNELGLAVQVEVRGKDQPPAGDAARPRQSDHVAVWIDTRDARSGHRASRTCHQFFFLPAGGGAQRDEPAFVQAKINRALAEAPQAPEAVVPFRFRSRKGGYVLHAFLSAAALHGFDPEQHPRLGLHYRVHDIELGEQSLSVGSDFPCEEDPSLWSVLELVRGEVGGK